MNMNESAIYEYRGKLVRAVDGDTVILKLTRTFSITLDVGFGHSAVVSHDAIIEHSFRILGINTPELIGPRREEALRAKAALDALLAGKTLRVVSHKDDKYGRYLATIGVPMSDGYEIDVATHMIAGGYAVAYNGTGPRT
jgi:endonuclease YncB( thermonuclease family)